MRKYLVVEFIGNNSPGNTKITRVTEEDLFLTLDSCKNTDRKISVYRIGECLLDWS